MFIRSAIATSHPCPLATKIGSRPSITAWLAGAVPGVKDPVPVSVWTALQSFYFDELLWLLIQGPQPNR